MNRLTHKHHSLFSALLLFLPLCCGVLGCSKAQSHSHDSRAATGSTFAGEYPIKVLCTTGQVAEMLTRIGGEHVEVQGLMGPGVDPHLYRPTASDVDAMLNADIIFYNGMHLEGRMADKFVQLARKKATYPVTEGIQLRHDKRLREPPEFDGLHDPHVWHDVALWADCVHDMAGVLGKFDPEHARQYDKNAHVYMEELAELHQYCKSEIAKIPESRRVLVTAHDAFGYFGAAYGIEVAGLKGISSEEEKDLAHQDAIQAMLIERKIPAVFVESAIAHRTVDSLIETCKAAGWDVVNGGELYADALGEAGSEASTYTEMIRHNVQTIVEALSK
ncbi:MAG: zinc ABC transporter substrate-binding protein [Pirellulales bacterium]|nr:zinc ABC transporter substrate-binding protein [Pirellulales bacterium]